MISSLTHRLLNLCCLFSEYLVFYIGVLFWVSNLNLFFWSENMLYMIGIILNLLTVVLQPITSFTLRVTSVFERAIYSAVVRWNSLWWQVCLYYCLCSSVPKCFCVFVPAFNFFIIIGFQGILLWYVWCRFIYVYLAWVLWASWTYRFMVFIKFEKFRGIITSDIFIYIYIFTLDLYLISSKGSCYFSGKLGKALLTAVSQMLL